MNQYKSIELDIESWTWSNNQKSSGTGIVHQKNFILSKAFYIKFSLGEGLIIRGETGELIIDEKYFDSDGEYFTRQLIEHVLNSKIKRVCISVSENTDYSDKKYKIDAF